MATTPSIYEAPPPGVGKSGYSSPRSKNQVMVSHGRAPWYGPDGRNVEAYVIGIAGGSASGKTSVARAILSALNYIPTVLILSQDSFYNKLSQEERALAFNNDLDLDHPNSIDTALFAKCLTDLKQGKSTEIPVYSFVHHQRQPETKYLYGASVIIVEGIMALQSAEMRALYDLKVFVNCDSDLMLARRIRRDVKERGRDVDGILDQYLRFVKSSYDNFVQPSSRYADIIVPGSSNQLAIELLVTHVKRQLDSRSLRFRKMLANQAVNERTPENRSMSGKPSESEGVILLEQTNQLLGIMTILRDRETTRSDFIFYADRLSTIIVEKALTLIPSRPLSVTTPTGHKVDGVTRDDDLVGISILRSGGPFSHGLRRVIRDVPIGAMLIQSDPKTGEPLLLKTDLPRNVKSAAKSGKVRVLLLDSQIGTGAAAMMAIRVLLDHGVSESHIIFLTYLISERGLYSVHRAFPDVKIVTASIDPGLDEMRIPYDPSSLMLGDAGEVELATRLVEPGHHASHAEGEGLTVGREEEEEEEEGVHREGEKPDPKDALKTEKEMSESQFKLPVKKGLEELKFSRNKITPAPTPPRSQIGYGSRDRRDSTTLGGNSKRIWVVTPGMGHIGDRYYM